MLKYLTLLMKQIYEEEKKALLYQILAFTIHGEIVFTIQSSYNNNKFKISTPKWNDKFELPDGSYFISDIQDYFEYIKKKMEKRLIILQ